jgi:hypothetical protein
MMLEAQPNRVVKAKTVGLPALRPGSAHYTGCPSIILSPPTLQRFGSLSVATN